MWHRVLNKVKASARRTCLLVSCLPFLFLCYPIALSCVYDIQNHDPFMFPVFLFQFQDILLNSIHVLVYPDVQFGSFIHVPVSK